MSPSMSNPHQIDARKEPRVNVSWRAQLQMADGRVIDARVRDISENGLGVVVSERVMPHQPLTLSVLMPDIEDPARIYQVTCTILPVFVVLQGHDYRIGAQWQTLQSAARALVKAWIRRIQHGI
ncbi:MAG: hypothetical protein RLY71_638 [Pseudomonadota bacterium]